MKKILIFISLLLSIGFANQAFAASPISIPNLPIQSLSSVGPKPNIMYLLDTSGSMALDYLGDYVGQNNNCKSAYSQFSRPCDATGTVGGWWGGNSWFYQVEDLYQQSDAGDTPFFSYSLNDIYYNPNIVYMPGVDYTGTSLGNESFTAAQVDPYLYPNVTVNLSTQFTETYWCKVPYPSDSEMSNTSYCERNGINTPNPFDYYTQALPNTTYRYPVIGTTPPFYYVIQPKEYCDLSMVNCSSSSTAGIPATVRWCKDKTSAMSTSVISGKYKSGSYKGQNICQFAYDNSHGYIYPRYGNFLRVNIPASQQQNFANWYSYYRTRILATKTAIGIAFSHLDSSKRVGFVTINPGYPVRSQYFVPIHSFDSDQKQLFYKTVYQQYPGGGTPLRMALSRVGRYYAGKTDGINQGMIIPGSDNYADPVQYACQQNFTILSTDGYWNGYYGGFNLNGNNPIGNWDNVNSGYSSRSIGAYDGGLSGASSTLADVAMYYYKTNLRPTGPFSQGGVPISSTDPNPYQHMDFYAMSLGAPGYIPYSSNYMTGGNPYFEDIKQGLSGACYWTTGVCNWPVPVPNELSAIDDLWHATVDGHGLYFNAQNANDIVQGIENSLNAMNTVTASSASAVTSSPNITSTNDGIYLTTYRTAKWDGEIVANTVDPTTGLISTTPTWSARSQLQSMVSSNSDSRNIYFMENSSNSSNLTSFQLSNMNSTEQSYFENLCTTNSLNQCLVLSSSNQNLINNGTDLVNYLRGQNGFEETNATSPLFRNRDWALGDIVDSSPVYVGASSYLWTDPGYSTYAASTTSKTPMLIVGGNDGMIHAFNANTGTEMWAVIPKEIMNKLYKLADYNYAANHQFYVDGQVSVMDAQINGQWKTVAIIGLGAGGKGYIALDITNPSSPKALWEFCNDPSVCSVSDPNIGYTYGNPIITKRAFDGKWVAYLPAGYNNASGQGLIYEVDLGTGQILRTLTTGTGSPSSPAGISKINAYYDSFNTNNEATTIYAGDLDGHIWKWDLTNPNATTATLLGTATDPNGNPQPITTKIELGTISGYPVLFFGTGEYLQASDATSTQVQSVYAIEDRNTNYGNLRNNSNIIAQNLTTSSTYSTASTNSVNWANDYGWYFDLTSQSGERVNIDPILSLGTLNVIANVPGSNICSAGGNSWIYQINFLTGGNVQGATNNAVGTEYTGGLIVGQVVASLNGSGVLKDYITAANGTVTPVGITVGYGSATTQKSSWEELN